MRVAFAFAVLAAMFASGLANGLINAPIWTIFTLRTPAVLRPKAWAAIFIDAQGTAARGGEEIRNASLDSSRPSAHGDNT